VAFRNPLYSGLNSRRIVNNAGGKILKKFYIIQPCIDKYLIFLITN